MRVALIALLALAACSDPMPPTPDAYLMPLEIPAGLKSCPTGPAEPPELPPLRTVDMLLSSNKALRDAYRGMKAARGECSGDARGAVRWIGANTVLPGKSPLFLKGNAP